MKLLESFQMGSLMLKNRMVMAAMTRSRADIHGVVGPMTAEYYAQRGPDFVGSHQYFRQRIGQPAHAWPV